ncbi:MAG: glycosyltransferase [Acidimicrobiales bacterium]
MPRVLFLLPSLPLPVTGGSPLRSLQLLRATETLCETHAYALTPHRALDTYPTTWWAATTSHRPPDVDARTMLDWARQADGHPTDRLWTADAQRDLAGVLERVQPDVAVVTLAARRAMAMLRATVSWVVYDAHNVEGPLYQGQLAAATASGNRKPSGLLRLVSRRTTEVEAALVGDVDQIWTCSETDSAAIRGAYPGAAPTVVVPNTVAVPGELPKRPAGKDVELLFPANFDYFPNIAAARWLCEELMPRLWDGHPSARLLLVGSAGRERLKELRASTEHEPRIEISGFVVSTEPYFARASIVVVPLREGSGTRMKVLEAFAAGVPVVSTAKGVEGLAVRDTIHYLRAESGAEFQTGVLTVWTDPDQTAARCAAAFRLAGERYGTAAAVAAIGSALGIHLSSGLRLDVT